MSRKTTSNSTERIRALLDEFEELRIAYEALWAASAQALSDAALMALPSAPSLIQFEREKMRQHLTYKKVLSTRHKMRLARLRNVN